MKMSVSLKLLEEITKQREVRGGLRESSPVTIQELEEGAMEREEIKD
jgi:hypothetical protein